ncbi:MAG: hypothetical protein R6U20_11930 [Longimonas sp.]|uniref:hypothetical protein n=1 Tax=Longimonas sp. TaxID=2039626 RepID=UPI003975DB86
MPCLFAALALVVPRGAIIALYLLTDWFVGVFPAIWWPIVGFLFAPTFTLWYSAVVHWYDGTWGLLQIVVGIIALIIDLSPAKEAS